MSLNSSRPLEADELRKAGPEDPRIPQPSKAVRIPCVLDADVLGTVQRAQPCSSRTGEEKQPENWPISFEECHRQMTSGRRTFGICCKAVAWLASARG